MLTWAAMLYWAVIPTPPAPPFQGGRRAGAASPLHSPLHSPQNSPQNSPQSCYFLHNSYYRGRMAANRYSRGDAVDHNPRNVGKIQVQRGASSGIRRATVWRRMDRGGTPGLRNKKGCAPRSPFSLVLCSRYFSIASGVFTAETPLRSFSFSSRSCAFSAFSFSICAFNSLTSGAPATAGAAGDTVSGILTIG